MLVTYCFFGPLENISGFMLATNRSYYKVSYNYNRKMPVISDKHIVLYILYNIYIIFVSQSMWSKHVETVDLAVGQNRDTTG